MTNMVIPRELLWEVRDYLEGAAVTWDEAGHKEDNPEIQSLLDDIATQLSVHNCPKCHGPMVIQIGFEDPFCGSWLYMEGGCAPVPKRRK